MKTAAVFLICLIASSYAFSLRSERLNAMKKLTYSSMFMEIEAQIRANGPLSAITGTIQGLSDQIRGEQAEHTRVWEIQMADCKEEIEFRNAEISEGQDALKRAKTHFTACKHSLEKGQTDLVRAEGDLSDSQSALATAIAIRKSERELFEQREADHKYSLEVIHGAIEFLDELVGGEATLLQLTSHTANMLKTGAKINLIQAYAPTIAYLAQMAASEDDLFVDEGAVERCRQMMFEMIENVQQSLFDLQEAEQASIDAFQILKANLEQTIADLKALIIRLRDHIQEMTQCVLEEEVVINQSQAKIDRNTKMLAAAEQMCTAFDQEYQDASEGRAEELDLLKIIQTIADKRIQGYGDPIMEFKDEISDYEELVYEEAAFVGADNEGVEGAQEAVDYVEDENFE